MMAIQKVADDKAEEQSEKLAASLNAESPTLEETQQKVKLKRDKELNKRTSDLEKTRTVPRKKRGRAPKFSMGKDTARRRNLKLRKSATDAATTGPASPPAPLTPTPLAGTTATGNSSDVTNDDDLEDGDDLEVVSDSSDSTGSSPLKKRPARTSHGRGKDGPGGAVAYEPTAD